ncbi:hypothetical protein GLW08_12625 [Pontibacillus yanchengensis]|uniref:Uncharacterized protein n=1 Tax=Pontibacillus yanchengensis TaxID=462910 RepID=A0ACC7VHC5_9BACI|nr:hypothetical protein [Pontibacillus yanchengensis]MYL54182.1 hypothetical protein [Pontibacillus yanchengensis]
MRYIPNMHDGTVKTLKEVKQLGMSRGELIFRGYLTNFFGYKQYNGQEYYILRKKVGDDYYKFEKVSRSGTKHKLPKLLHEGWEIVKEPTDKEE